MALAEWDGICEVRGSEQKTSASRVAALENCRTLWPLWVLFVTNQHQSTTWESRSVNFTFFKILRVIPEMAW